MKMKIKEFFDKDNLSRLVARLVRTWKAYPLVLFFSYTLGAIGVYRIESDYAYGSRIYESLDRLVLTLLLGIVIQLIIDRAWRGSGKIVRLEAREGGKGEGGGEGKEDEDKGASLSPVWLVASGLNLAFLALYFVFLTPAYQETIFMVRHFILIGAGLLVYSLVPYLRGYAGYAFHLVRLVLTFLETLVYGLVLALGLTAVFFAIENLLYAGMSSTLYGHIWLLTFTLFAPTYFLASLGEKVLPASRSEVGKVLKGLFVYVIVPLLSLYSLVLYLYFFRILISRDWPSGMVSYLVVFSSAVGVATILFLYPLEKEDKISQVFCKWYPRLVLPLLAMMYVAIFMRIGQYGYTENRYYILLIGIWLTAAYLYYVWKKGEKNQIVVGLLALAMVFSVLGPLSSFSVSIRSQNARFNSILERNDMWSAAEGRIIEAGPEVSEADLRQLYDITDYFRWTHQLEDLDRLDVPEAPKDPQLGQGGVEPPGSVEEAIESLLGRPRPDRLLEEGQRRYHDYYWPQEERKITDIAGYSHMVFLYVSDYDKDPEAEKTREKRVIETPEGTLSLEVSEELVLEIKASPSSSLGEEGQPGPDQDPIEAEIDLEAYYQNLVEELGKDRVDKFTSTIMEIDKEVGDWTVRVQILHMSGNTEEGLSYSDLVVFVGPLA